MNDKDKHLPEEVDKDKKKVANGQQKYTKNGDVNEFPDSERMPAEFKKVMSVFQASIMRGGMMTHPLMEKFNEEHISKFLEYSKDDDIQDHKFKSSNRFFTAFYILIFAAIFIFLTIFLTPTNKDMYFEILKILGIFAGGMGSGFGLKIFLDRKNSS